MGWRSVVSIALGVGCLVLGPAPFVGAAQRGALAPNTTRGTDYVVDFNGLHVGQALPLWRNVTSDGYAYPWLYAGSWRVAPSDVPLQSLLLAQTAKRPQPALTFLRFDGSTFGANGALPWYYRAQVNVQPLGSDTKGPTGDLGVQVYYLNPTHYVEVLIKNNVYQVWLDHGGVPVQTAGWTLLWKTPYWTTARQMRTLGAVVDTQTGIIQPILNGRIMTTLRVSLGPSAPHWFAVRAAGQAVNFWGMSIVDLGAAGPVKPYE